MTFVVCALVLTSGVAAASERLEPVVVLADGIQPRSELAAAAESTLSAGIAGRDARLVGARSLEFVAESAALSARHDAALAAARTLKLAHKAREAGSIDDAQSRYTEAAASFESSDLRYVFDEFIEALAWSATLGHNDTAMRLVLTVRPELAFAARELTPADQKWFDKQRAAKASATKVSFDLRSSTPALVWIDGVQKGLTPLRVDDVIAGRHRIAAWAPGYALLQTEETISGGAQVELKLDDTPSGIDLRAGLEAIRGGFRTGEYLSPHPSVRRARPCLRGDRPPPALRRRRSQNDRRPHGEGRSSLDHHPPARHQRRHRRHRSSVDHLAL